MKGRAVLVLGIFLLIACSRSYDGNPYPKIERSGDVITITQSPTSTDRLLSSDIVAVEMGTRYHSETGLWVYRCKISQKGKNIYFDINGAHWEGAGRIVPSDISKYAKDEFNKIKKVIL
jgi:hypothetical protein